MARRPAALPARAARPRAETLGAALLRDGLVQGDDMVQALSLQARRRGRLADILLARGLIGPEALYHAMARHWGTRVVDPTQEPPDVRLVDRLGAGFCLRHKILPWRDVGGTTVIATAEPEEFARHRPQLAEVFGPVAMAITPAPDLQEALLRLRGPSLARDAEQRVAEPESCRNFTGKQLVRPLILVLVAAGVAALVAPAALGWLILGWALLSLLLVTLLKLAAGLAALPHRPGAAEPAPEIIRQPVVSVIVALHRESDIAPRLVRRLARLDYPRELLDIVLVVEAEDRMTRSALEAADLPPWMRMVVVPDGQIKTKPRALNFALDQCRGEIVGVYDAEDAPDPDQIQRVVQRFYQRGPQVACLQGILDFYNPHTNWLSRCFTIEYAAWFRLMLPGLARLGLPIPLGGTTLFFRRSVLEELGGWDAHNVTEDADLGVRLYRHGYRTELIATVTGEEANCRAIPWVKQRSRWLKGYMMTWATHMRDPGLLLRQLGPWQFAGFQVLFLCSLSQFLLAPFLWSFWLPLFGLPHPLVDAMPAGAVMTMTAVFLSAEGLNLAIMTIGLRRSGQRLSPLWVPTLHFYFPLGALAAYKAAWEVLRNPFYWDKTTHGHFDPVEG